MTGLVHQTEMKRLNVQVSNRRNARNEGMKYSVGDIVKFRLESGEIQKGNVHYIEGNGGEDLLYINSFNRWAYKVPENRILSRVYR